MTLDKYLTPNQKVELKTEKVNRRKNFLLKYNLTQEALVDANGRRISDAILYKAEKFIELNLVEQLASGVDDSRFVVKPILGYNCTPYGQIIWVHGDEVVGGCNCQFSSIYNKLCSHLLAVLIKYNLWNGKRITIRGGVRN